MYKRFQYNRSIILILVFFLFFSTIFFIEKGLCNEVNEAKLLVERARLTLENFYSAEEMENFRILAKKAKGFFISPQILKGAFLFGASGGSGVFIAKDPKTNEFSYPAFYTLGEVSFGLQIGGESAEVIMVIMSEKGTSALLSSSVKLGVDVGIAVGPVGAGVDASTANTSADIITFSKSKGLYGGLSLEGAFVKTRNDWNKAYYGMEVTPMDIIIKNKAKNPHAKPLMEMAQKIISGK